MKKAPRYAGDDLIPVALEGGDDYLPSPARPEISPHSRLSELEGCASCHKPFVIERSCCVTVGKWYASLVPNPDTEKCSLKL